MVLLVNGGGESNEVWVCRWTSVVFRTKIKGWSGEKVNQGGVP